MKKIRREAEGRDGQRKKGKLKGPKKRKRREREGKFEERKENQRRQIMRGAEIVKWKQEKYNMKEKRKE